MVSVKSNFENKYGSDLSCTLCNFFEESQEHLLSFPELIPQSDIKHMDIFGSLDEQIEVAKHWNKVMLERRIKLKERETSLCREATRND